MLMENKAFIPLYLNEDVVNNLFTIVVQEFVDSKTISCKDQITISCKLPLSEFSHELFGKYIQGDINVQIVNEFSKQKTRAEISKNIEIFMSLRNILLENKLLKYIDNNEPIGNIHENDFIIMNCEIGKNPMFNYLQNSIAKMKIQNTLGGLKDDNGETIKNLSAYLDDWKKNRCIKHFTNELCSPKSRFIVPIEDRHVLTNIEYITKRKVNVMGKVINRVDMTNESIDGLIGDTFLDFVNENYFLDFISNYIDIKPMVSLVDKGYSTCKNIIEIIPIAIFL